MSGTTVSSDLKKKNYFLKNKDFDYLILLLFLTHISTEGKKREILSFPSTVDPLCLNFNLSINFFIELLIFYFPFTIRVFIIVLRTHIY